MDDLATGAALPLLFSPIRIAGHTVRNRIMMPSMHTGYANSDGTVSPRLLAYLEARAPGVGILTLELSSIHPTGRMAVVNELAFSDDSHIAGVRQVAELAHRHGALGIIQISHAGRQTTRETIGTEPVAPSAVTCPLYTVPPRELEAAEIPALQDVYVEAATRAHRAGLDGVELHAGHGFLMGQFLSPYFNRRTDEWGGDTLRRARFVTEVIRRIRQRLGPAFVIGLRLSITEGFDQGLSVPESQRLGVLFAEAGMDMLHCSAGMTFNRYLYCPPIGREYGCNLEFSSAMKEVLEVPVIAAGRLHDPRVAEAAIRDGKADMVSIGRGLLCDPLLPIKAARGRFDDIRLCVGCNQGCGTRPASCMLNPELGRELDDDLLPAAASRSVVVIGGGPAGLEAARVAALRGHRVQLIERADHLGGQFALAAVPPAKSELLGWIEWSERQLRQMGVEIRLGQQADAEFVAALHPDCIIVATGGVPLRPPIPGLGAKQVVTAIDVLDGRVDPGREVVVLGGGMTGCETADYLADNGHHTTIVEMLPEVARDVPREPRYYLFERLTASGVDIMTSTRVVRIENGSVFAEGPTGGVELKCDTVVLAVGVASERTLADELRRLVHEVHVVGDASSAGNAQAAIRQGFEVGCLV